MTTDLASIARELKKTPEQIEATVKLLDDGNTIPFITRFRKDETGGLNEEAIQSIKQRVAKSRAIEERRSFILKSIESQNKLDDELAKKINAAQSSRELEDLYLPFKPKKQTLATVAKQGGLEPLALDIFEGRSPDIDLATRATDFVRVDKGLTSVDEVIKGVGYLLAERFSDRADVRGELRDIIWQSASLVVTAAESAEQKKRTKRKLKFEPGPKPATKHQSRQNRTLRPLTSNRNRRELPKRIQLSLQPIRRTPQSTRRIRIQLPARRSWSNNRALYPRRPTLRRTSRQAPQQTSIPIPKRKNRPMMRHQRQPMK